MAEWWQTAVFYEIYVRGFADHGYDVAGHVDVDPRFGTLDDFHALLADA